MMSPALARPLLHAAHLLTLLMLLGTGLLLFMPDLRAAVTGGYALVIRETHCWGGVAFVVLPVLILLGSGMRAAFPPSSQRRARAVWQGIHVGLAVVVSGVLALTGFALWGEPFVPAPLAEASLVLHDWFTYIAIASLIAHLLDVGPGALVARLRTGRGAKVAEL